MASMQDMLKEVRSIEISDGSEVSGLSKTGSNMNKDELIDKIVDLNTGLKLPLADSYSELVIMLLAYPLDWDNLSTINIVGANVRDKSYELALSFSGNAKSFFRVSINNFEMRIE